jgi:hypothetical protein
MPVLQGFLLIREDWFTVAFREAITIAATFASTSTRESTQSDAPLRRDRSQ